MNALASLSESARKIALDRFRLRQPHLEEKMLLKAVAPNADIRYRTAQSGTLAILWIILQAWSGTASPTLA
jgi:hypothetical protein